MFYLEAGDFTEVAVLGEDRQIVLNREGRDPKVIFRDGAPLQFENLSDIGVVSSGLTVHDQDFIFQLSQI